MFLFTSDCSSIGCEQQQPTFDTNLSLGFPEHSNSKTRNFQSISEHFGCLGLKEMSKSVCEIIKNQKKTNLQLILSEIKKLHPQSTNTVNQSRRVYDCLNVMMAMGIIKKCDKTYEFMENSNNFQNQEIRRQIDNLSMVKFLIEQNLQEKRKVFSHLTKRQAKLDKLVFRNQNLDLDEQEQIFQFPLLVLKTQIQENIQVGYNDQEVLVQSQNIINIQQDLDVIIELNFDD
ncbi:unnamed protein product [Paramecium primaurelia]|uniref:E2F/DP family winged-helix DNA-binding domain-containing protein n=1 Tax=Paramecium primaurelia TaxID=5886 RepID=A0A8S1JN41_PARPR|nr:unnamed protein product [Paramecium primaurelia]